ncbi:MAG: preprotein translocase subunit SecF, partial [Actinomycetota bacterium]|nr:preprotein translocase subunit SecF [Actinomycetota bacterium]
MGLASRLYRGETEFPLIQKRKTFYVISLVFVVICLASMIFRGFNVGEEFKGGASFSWPAGHTSVAQARSAIEDLGVSDPTVQTVGRSNGDTDIRVTTGPLTDNKIDEVIQGISAKFKVDDANIDSANVGASWGKQVTKKALQGLVLFLIAVIIYISIRFEPKMAIAAIVALIHDLILTAGIYSITHFVVTPATVIALLTVLGYSLYDTIVVFDKVEENTRGLAGRSTQTYSEAAELAVNQTFMRSINTSLIALLPVSGLLFVGAFLLGAGTLKDLALALFVGLASGAYSSLFLATPLLADLKEREPQYKALQQRVLARRSGTTPKAGSKFQQRAAARVAGTPQPVSAETVVIEEAAPTAATTTPSAVPPKA